MRTVTPQILFDFCKLRMPRISFADRINAARQVLAGGFKGLCGGLNFHSPTFTQGQGAKLWR